MTTDHNGQHLLFKDEENKTRSKKDRKERFMMQLTLICNYIETDSLVTFFREKQVTAAHSYGSALYEFCRLRVKTKQINLNMQAREELEAR